MTVATDLAQHGFATIPYAIPRSMVVAAQQLVAPTVTAPMTSDAITTYTRRTFAPELVGDRRLLDLYDATMLRPLCDELVSPGFFDPIERCQLQIRLPNRRTQQPAKDLHVDGVACRHLPTGTLNTFTVLVGVMLSAVTEESGPLEVAVGGHRTMAHWFAEHGPRAVPEDGEVPDEALALPRQRVTGDAGDAVILHHLTPHAAGENREREPRLMVYFRLRHRAHDVLAEAALSDPWLELPALERLESQSTR